VIEVAAFAVLAVLALSPATQRHPAGPVASRSAMLARLREGVPGARAATAAVSVAALVLLGVAVAGANEACAAYWPPVTGTPAAGPGVTGKLGTIKRSDGATQVTYDGHPLYTYIADTAPGQAHGNNLNLNGGLWHEVTVSG
jgi:Secreted repeat of unknown function